MLLPESYDKLTIWCALVSCQLLEHYRVKESDYFTDGEDGGPLQGDAVDADEVETS